MKEIKPVKIITLLGIIWFFTLLAIWRFDNKNHFNDTGNELIDERQAYEDALNKFELMRTRKNNNSNFGVRCEYCT